MRWKERCGGAVFSDRVRPSSDRYVFSRRNITGWLNQLRKWEESASGGEGEFALHIHFGADGFEPLGH
jgi:hypothetical protein